MTPWLAAVAAFIGLILVVTLIVVLLGPIARRLAKRDHKSQSEVHVEALNATRDTLLKATSGFVLFLGALGTVGTLYYTAKTTATGQQQAAAAQEQVTIAGDEALTGRYTRAVDQIASDKADARVGGVYALERIMKDSPHDQPTIVEVLAAFLREHARIRDEDSQPPGDVQAAVTVLARRHTENDDPVQHVDLHDAFLNNAEFDHGSFQRSDLSGTHLGGAEFIDATLTGADLGSADLSGAILTDARADGAIFDSADLTGANLTRASLRGADLRKAVFDGETTLNETDLTGADLRGADLRGVDLRKARGLTPQQLATAKRDGRTRLS